MRSTPGKKMTKTKAHFFTILELIICITILALLGGLAMVKAPSMLDQYRFQNSASKLRRELEVTKTLASISGGDITFEIRQEKNKLCCIRTTPEPLKFPRMFNRTIFIDHVDHISLNDNEKTIVSLVFTGTCWINTPGTLTLHSPNKAIYSIPLPSLLMDLPKKKKEE